MEPSNNINSAFSTFSFLVISVLKGAEASSSTLSPSSIAGISFVFGFISLVLILAGICRCYRRRQLKTDQERSKRLKIIGDILREHTNDGTSVAEDPYLVVQKISSPEQDPLSTGDDSQIEVQEPKSQELVQDQELSVEDTYLQRAVGDTDSDFEDSNSEILVDDLNVDRNKNSPTMVVQTAHTQKYTDWRTSQGTMMYTRQQPVQYNTTYSRQQPVQYNTTTYRQQQVQRPVVPMTFDRQYVVRQSNRSTSPVRTPRERGRSTTRQFVYTQQPNTSIRVQGIDVPVRSKSAPPINRGTVRRVVAREPLVYTKSHFMAIKKPGSKKYLLPPTKVYTEAKQTNRTVVVERQAPAPVQQRQRLVGGGVYHVQYNPETANIVRNRGYTVSGDRQRYIQTPIVQPTTPSAPTTPRYYQQSQQQQEFVFSRRATENKQPIKLASYTPKIIQGTALTTEDRSHTWATQNGGVANGTTVWSSDDMYMSSPMGRQLSAAQSLPDLALPPTEGHVFHVEYTGKLSMKATDNIGDSSSRNIESYPYEKPVYVHTNDVTTGLSHQHATHMHGSGNVTQVWTADKGWTSETGNWSAENVLNTRRDASFLQTQTAAVKTHTWSANDRVDDKYTIVDYVDDGTVNNGTSRASTTYDHIRTDEHTHALNDLDSVIKTNNEPSSSSSSSAVGT